MLGGHGEDREVAVCHRMAGIDSGLWEIIKVWHTLPEVLRKEVEAKCLEPVFCGVQRSHDSDVE